jgi:hypothetical protein
LTVKEFREALMSLGLTPTAKGTELIEVWRWIDGFEFFLPKPEHLSEEDRRETFDYVKETLGLGKTRPAH